MGRPLSPPQIHQKNISKLSKFYKTTSECWQRTSGTQKSRSLSSKTERRNPAPLTRTPTQASLTKKPWQATDTTPRTVRKLHNKENSTNSQNTDRPAQTQQYNQDEETEEYPAGKGKGEMPMKPNKRGDRESTWERIPNIDSEKDPKSWNQNGITDK